PSTAPARDALAGLIPVSIVTGFLGSGKTTLNNRLLKRPEMNRVAVIVNELGEIGIDNELVEVSSEQMMLLNNGCLCCVLRGDLQETLRELFIKRRNGEIIDFDRVVIETTGLADPAPVMQTLITDTLLLELYRLDCVATLVDAVNAPGQLEQYSEPVKQVALADRLVVTKTDLITEKQLAALTGRLHEINPNAPVRIALNGEIELSFLVDVGLRRASARLEEVERWLGDLQAHDHDGEHRHDDQVRTFVLRFDQPMPWAAFTQCMEVLTALRGPDLLRVKGLVNVEGKSGPMVVQGVQHLFHPPLELAAWPSGDRTTRLVFITRGITRETVLQLFSVVGALAADSGRPQ
ncbi:MAG: GTP-binding protein, partial [Betaproteobacteria bacterium]|nr:GTP-binding protein [Betaproteobacteria bacterium]